MVTESYHILVMWQNHYSQLFSVHEVRYLRQTEKHTEQPIVPEVRALDFFFAMFYVDTNYFWGIRQIFHTACLTKTSFLVSFWSMESPLTLSWRAAVFWLCKGRIIIRSLIVIWYEWLDETWAVLEVFI